MTSRAAGGSRARVGGSLAQSLCPSGPIPRRAARPPAHPFLLLAARWDEIPKEIADPEATVPDDWDEADDGEWEPTMVENPSPKMIANPDYGGDVYAYDFEAVGFELWTVNPIPSPCPVSHRTAPHRMRVAVAGGGRRRGAWRRRPRQPPGGPICAEGPARDRVSSARR